VDWYLPYFGQWLIIHPLLALLSFQRLLTNSSQGDQLLAPHPFSGALSEFPPSLLCVSCQLLAYCSGFFFARVGSVCPGGYAGLS
jgi:hypothetical protein